MVKLTLKQLPVSGACLVLSLFFASLRSIVHAQDVVGSALDTRCFSGDEFDPEIDYFVSKWEPTNYQPPPTKLSPAGDGFIEFAEDTTTDLFDISYYNHYKIITNHFVNKTYLLYLCGTEPPASELDGRHHLVLPIPHTGGIAVSETTQIPFLELLGLRNQIVGYIGDNQWVSSPCLNFLMNVANSTEVVYDSGDPYNTSLNNSAVRDFVDRHEDVIIVGGPYFNADADLTIIAAETQERTNVATFDWLGYYAAFFNLEAMSNRIVEETKSRYECSSSNADALASDKAANERPVVLWAEYFVGYNWSVAECPTWDNTYYCEYAMHCGARIVSRPKDFGLQSPDFGGRYWYVDDEQLLELGKDADIFIYPSSTWDSVYEEKNKTLDQMKSVQNKQVYDTQGPGPNMWYEQRLAEYDVVALDFCDVVGNIAPGSLHERKWFRNIFTEPVGSAGTCNAPNEIDEPYVAEGADCTPIDAMPSNEGITEGNSDTGMDENGTKPKTSSATTHDIAYITRLLALAAMFCA